MERTESRRDEGLRKLVNCSRLGKKGQTGSRWRRTVRAPDKKIKGRKREFTHILAQGSFLRRFKDFGLHKSTGRKEPRRGEEKILSEASSDPRTVPEGKKRCEGKTKTYWRLG